MLCAALLSPNSTVVVGCCQYCSPGELHSSLGKLIIALLWIPEWGRDCPWEKCLLVLLEQHECCWGKQSLPCGMFIVFKKCSFLFSSSCVCVMLKILSVREAFWLPFKPDFCAKLLDALPHCAWRSCWNSNWAVRCLSAKGKSPGAQLVDRTSVLMRKHALSYFLFFIKASVEAVLSSLPMCASPSWCHIVCVVLRGTCCDPVFMWWVKSDVSCGWACETRGRKGDTVNRLLSVVSAAGHGEQGMGVTGSVGCQLQCQWHWVCGSPRFRWHSAIRCKRTCVGSELDIFGTYSFVLKCGYWYSGSHNCCW